MVPPLLMTVISSTVLFAALVTPPRAPPPRALRPPRVFMAAEQRAADTASPPPAAPPAAPPEKPAAPPENVQLEDEDRWLAAEPVRLVSKSGVSADTLDDATDFDSAVGQGTMFTCTLPLSDKVQADGTVASAGTKAGRS